MSSAETAVQTTAAVVARPQAFAGEEYAARLGRVQATMAQRSLAGLVVVDPANIYYLTGYNAWSFYTPQCLLVPADGLPHLFARSMDAQGAHYTAYLDRQQIHGYPEHLVHRPDIHPFDWIADRAVELGLLADAPDAQFAAEADAHFFSPRGYLALQARLPRAALVDSHELVNWIRVVKSPAEQEMLRAAGAIAERVMSTLRWMPSPRDVASVTWWPTSSMRRHWAAAGSAATTPPSCRCSRPASPRARRT